MSTSRAFTSSADLDLSMPENLAARLDRIEIATASLRTEVARLERLGLARAASRCREQLRYWEFLGVLFSLTPDGSYPGEDA